ncbi:MAG: DUF2959 family protein [Gammaproteobacteria bacterium]
MNAKYGHARSASQIIPHATLLARRLMLCAGIALLSGCATVQYSALEKIGIEKRDILVDRVEDARDAQDETREELVSAYEALSELIDHDGGELEKRYRALDKAVDRSTEARDDLDERLTSIDRVSRDLFKEWDEELTLYTSETLRQDQTRKLGIARRQYAAMRERMQTARDRVNPVMSVLQDNRLFLKHSLNAQALNALRGQVATIDGQVQALIRDMQSAIDEANAFIANMRG